MQSDKVEILPARVREEATTHEQYRCPLQRCAWSVNVHTSWSRSSSACCDTTSASVGVLVTTMSFSGGNFLPALDAPQTSARLFCPPLRSPVAPFSHPPLAFRPSLPKSSLPAPTVSATRLPPPPRPPLYCSLSLRFRETRHDVDPERRFSAR
jgi:hypothetical protein